MGVVVRVGPTSTSSSSGHVKYDKPEGQTRVSDKATWFSLKVSRPIDGCAARCPRDGGIIAVVNPPHGSVTVSKSTRDISVNCTRPGHLPAVASHVSQFQGMTAGNLLFGGLIGLGIHAASGALSHYPPNLILSLPPQTFASEQSREGFFSQRAADTRRVFDERIRAVDTGSGPGERHACNERMQALGRERDEELARLDAQRRNTRIGS